MMARKPTIDPIVVNKAQEIANATKCASTLRLCQSVLLPARLGSTLEQTAAILGVGRATVPRMQKSFRARFAGTSPAPPRNWGGRRRQLMTPAQEKEFLQPWLEKAASGCMVVVAPIRAALAQHLNKPVAASVVYKLLARHGWRKVAPDTRHPKGDPKVQEDWKKNSRKNWRPSSSPKSSRAER
jgi:transposase